MRFLVCNNNFNMHRNSMNLSVQCERFICEIKINMKHHRGDVFVSHLDEVSSLWMAVKWQIALISYQPLKRQTLSLSSAAAIMVKRFSMTSEKNCAKRLEIPWRQFHSVLKWGSVYLRPINETSWPQFFMELPTHLPIMKTLFPSMENNLFGSESGALRRLIPTSTSNSLRRSIIMFNTRIRLQCYIQNLTNKTNRFSISFRFWCNRAEMRKEGGKKLASN